MALIRVFLGFKLPGPFIALPRSIGYLTNWRKSLLSDFFFVQSSPAGWVYVLGNVHFYWEILSSQLYNGGLSATAIAYVRTSSIQL